MAKRGRPSVFSASIAAEICRRVSSGESLRAVCRDDEFPPEATVRSWAIDDVCGFFAQYTRAKEIRADTIFDEMLEISDKPVLADKITIKADGSTETVIGDAVERSRLMIDARKWTLGRMKPKVYGDRVQHTGDAENPIVSRVEYGWSEPTKPE